MLKRNKLKLKEILTILFLIISFFLSISAIAIANYRTAYILKYDNNSFYGWVVAVLGIFVTILILETLSIVKRLSTFKYQP